MRQKYYTDHIEVGRTVFHSWKLPEQLQEIISRHNFPPEEAENASEMLRLTALASLTAREMLELQLPMSAMAQKAKLMDMYNAVDMIETQFGPGYYAILKEHPFYKQAVSG